MSQCPTLEDESLLPVWRALMRAHTQIERVGARHIESLGLTPSQFDVLVTLGDTPGLTCGELGGRTFITRGTLIPVLDRLEARGLVKRCKGERDSRQTVVSLTPAGQAQYKATFGPHVAYMKPLLDRLEPAEQGHLIALLGRLEQIFAAAPSPDRPQPAGSAS